MKILAAIILAATVCAAQVQKNSKTICPPGIFPTLPDDTNRTCDWLLLFADDGRREVVNLHQDNSPNQGDWSYGIINLSGKVMHGLKFHVSPDVDGNCPDGNGDGKHSPNVKMAYDFECHHWYVFFPAGLWPGQSAWFSSEGDLGIVGLDPDPLSLPVSTSSSVLNRLKRRR